MVTMYYIQKASLYDPRRLLVDGEVKQGVVELGQRVFLRRRKFVVDAIASGRKTALQQVEAGAQCELILRSVAPLPIPPELIRFAQGQILQIL